MLNLKIDTKDKFNEIKVLEHQLTANMTADLQQILSAFLVKPVKNVILQLTEVTIMDMEAAETLASLHRSFYGEAASFVVCGLQQPVKAFLDEQQMLDAINIAPTLSEAWDIVQMEEIERELLG